METLIPVGLCLAVFGLQLWLCFGRKRLLLRLLPVILSAAAAAVLFALTASVQGWDALGYLIFGLLAVAFLVVCGTAWLIRLLVHLIRRARAVREEK